MRDVLDDIERWRAEGIPIALATVIQTWGSAPRTPGSKMAMTADGKISGSVSGGCVETAVVEAGTRVIATGKPQRLHFGVSDESAWSVGLACGGTIDVFVEPLPAEIFEPIRDAIRQERTAATVTLVGGPDAQVGKKLVLLEDGKVLGAIGGGLDRPAEEAARAALAEGASRRVELPGAEPAELFADVLLPAPRLIIVGGVHIAVALVSLAKTLGFRTVVVDPREAFGNAARFPHADQLVSAWPDRALEQLGINSSTAIAVLTHDPKLDDPALMTALQSPAFYVGALGSSRTQEKRRRRLLEAGLGQDALARLYAPIGLDLGGRSPEEIALSVMAQIVAARNRRSRTFRTDI
jgi:xanthine dehydrogenase accessory factor